MPRRSRDEETLDDEDDDDDEDEEDEKDDGHDDELDDDDDDDDDDDLEMTPGSPAPGMPPPAKIGSTPPRGAPRRRAPAPDPCYKRPDRQAGRIQEVPCPARPEPSRALRP